uniref:ScyR8 n=1 Tax=Scytalidium album TaxID=1525810 RepID=A0A8A5D4W9_9PEZI|nr:ScyR8 [Scytalidium album]
MEIASQSPPASALKDSNGPKQPKLRSTCDACQDAKTRCSHDNPRCRRCETRNIKCVYSISRRMGRPRRLKTNESDPKQPKNKSNNVSRAMELGVATSSIINPEAGATVQVTAITEATTRPTFQNSMTTPSWNEAGSMSGIDVFDTNLGSLDCLDFSGSSNTSSVCGYGFNFLLQSNSADSDFNFSDFTENSTLTASSGLSPAIEDVASAGAVRMSKKTDSYFMFPGLSSSEDDASLEKIMASGFSPQALPSISVDSIFQGDMSVEDLSNKANNSEIMDFSVDFQPVRNKPQQQQEKLIPGTTTWSELTKPDKKCAPSPEPDNRMCNCFASILRELPHLDQSRLENQASTIDVVLRVEQGFQQQASKILSCKTCMSNRPSLLLLSAVVIDHIVCMLENTFNVKLKLQRKSSNEQNNPPFRPSPARTVVKPVNGQKVESTGGVTPTCDCLLLVGGQEIVREEKIDFLKQLVQGRLGKLCSTLRQLRTGMQETPQDSNSKAGTIMVMEIYRRLQSVIARDKKTCRRRINAVLRWLHGVGDTPESDANRSCKMEKTVFQPLFPKRARLPCPILGNILRVGDMTYWLLIFT